MKRNTDMGQEMMIQVKKSSLLPRSGKELERERVAVTITKEIIAYHHNTEKIS